MMVAVFHRNASCGMFERGYRRIRIIHRIRGRNGNDKLEFKILPEVGTRLEQTLLFNYGHPSESEVTEAWDRLQSEVCPPVLKQLSLLFDFLVKYNGKV
ncbi:unnamed protein product [Enterobius vermicularis]|uniref:DUF4160 domain-containing protein n=1 Tax=Enterobius vermicularis TaxID=51028 RepID=A0A0N4UYH3_ENTVE|nr:unnamed protein product [Enterobius vermicularis]